MEEQRRFVRSNANMDALRSEQDRKRRRRSVIYLSLFLSVTLIFFAVCFFVFFKVSMDFISQKFPIKRHCNFV